jgi:ubiquinone biosynthesis protein
MRALAVFLESVDDELARYRPSVLVAEFEAMMRAAIDLTAEQANLKRFTANFEDEPDVVIPSYYATLSSAKVLTMERMVGDRLTDGAAVQDLGWVIDDLVDRATGIYLKMIFHDGTYHADPHPGNFLLRPGKEIVVLDFGDVGYLSSSRQEQLETLLIAMTSHDLDDLTDAIVDITDAPADTDLDRLRADLDRWSSQYVNDDLANLDVAGMISSAMGLMHTHALSLPSDLATLFRVLLLLQGMAAQLGASNNLGALMQPYVDQMIKKRLDPRALGRQALKSVRDWSDLLRVLPNDLRDLMAHIKDGRVDVDFQLHDPDGRVDQVVDGMIVAAMVVAAGELLSRETRPILGQVSLPGATAVALGVLSYRRLRGKRDDYVSATSQVTRLLKFARTRRTAGSSG